MTSKERIQCALQHKAPDTVPTDFGGTAVTGIHCRIIELLRKHYGLEERPVKISDPFQMLGEIDADLLEIIPSDVIGVYGEKDVFSINQEEFHVQKTSWGQEVLIAKGIDLSPHKDGSVYVYAAGDKSYPPSAVMPEGCYFINAIERQQEIDDENLNAKNNLEEFGYMTAHDIAYWTKTVNNASKSNKAIIASLGGAALGDAAFIPGMGLKEPKGIRSVTDWYMSTIMRPDHIHEIFENQIDIAINNYQEVWNAVGSKIDAVFTCGTDFGSQDSQFCSVESYRELWMPHYQKLNNWIHENTTWKVFKHSCGAILPLMPSFIDSGFDIINPVQINAKDMDSKMLKKEFGDNIVFWGGGVDTQKTLPNGTPEQVRDEVLRQYEVLGNNGGFVFNTIHNMQANLPIENVIALIETLREIRK